MSDPLTLSTKLDHIAGQLRSLAQRLEQGFPVMDAATLLQAYAQEIENLRQRIPWAT
jgi:DNA-binding FrmR family transcriptional regulator